MLEKALSEQDGWPMRKELMISFQDKIQILAFHKFLESGEWVEQTAPEPNVFLTDQLSFDYATGQIDSETYLIGDSSATIESIVQELWIRYTEDGELMDFR